MDTIEIPIHEWQELPKNIHRQLMIQQMLIDGVNLVLIDKSGIVCSKLELLEFGSTKFIIEPS